MKLVPGQLYKLHIDRTMRGYFWFYGVGGIDGQIASGDAIFMVLEPYLNRYAKVLLNKKISLFLIAETHLIEKIS